MALSSTHNGKITVIASAQGLEKANKSLIESGFQSKAQFAELNLLSRSTITKFFQRQPIQLDSFQAICEGLNLNWREIIETVENPEQLESNASGKNQQIILGDGNTLTPISEDVRVQFVVCNVHYDFEGANIGGGVAINNYGIEHKQSITYNFQGANVDGGITINNYTPEQKPSLTETAAEIQQLLKQLDTTHSSNTITEKMIVASETIELIESNPTLKQRIINALKAGGTEALRELISHPAASFVIGALKAWEYNEDSKL